MGLTGGNRESNQQPERDRLRKEYLAREQRKKVKDPYDYLNPAYCYTVQRRQAELLRILKKMAPLVLPEAKILEVGCGAGSVLLEMVLFGAAPRNLWGVDLLEWQLNKARARNPAINWLRADATQMPFKADAFDLVLQFTAFTSILDDAVKRGMAQEMLRVLKPSGAIVWYDFWLNPTNHQTKGIRPKEIKDLFPDCSYYFRKVTLAPPLAIFIAPFSVTLCQALEYWRLLNTHYLAVIKPRIQGIGPRQGRS